MASVSVGKPVRGHLNETNEILQLEKKYIDKNSEISPMQIPFAPSLHLFDSRRFYMEVFFPSRGCTILVEETQCSPLFWIFSCFLRSSTVRHGSVTSLVTLVALAV